LVFTSCIYAQRPGDELPQKRSIPVMIKWVSGIKGDFSFRKKWSYDEGIYRNRFGQLDCDGNCPEGLENMKDKRGRILKDSLRAFYKILDTSHYYHSIECDAWCYEWAGTDFIDVVKKSPDSFFCSTLYNAGTHCLLQMVIVGDTCYTCIFLNSVVSRHYDSNGVAWGGRSWYYCTAGSITIDKDLWNKGILKASFSFNFEHKEDPKVPIYWNGKIYSKMQDYDPGKFKHISLYDQFRGVIWFREPSAASQ